MAASLATAGNTVNHSRVEDIRSPPGERYGLSNCISIIVDRLSVYDYGGAAIPRTVNPMLHTVRREAFVDVAQHLIQTRGYEAMSIQDVLDAVGASRGAFYYYFDS